jgi:diacylglycerol kinase family enzyme
VSKQKIVFIVNPNSGTDRKKQSFLTHLQDFRKQSPFEVILEYTARAHHAKEIVNEYLAAGAKRFVAVGGDGTVNEVASQLIHKEATLYIIPKGSGNGLARHLGIPLDESGAFQTILKCREQTIDCGLIHGIPFLCTAGIGFDAYSAALFSGSKRRGFLTYIKTGVAAYKNYEPVPPRLSLTMDFWTAR